MVVGKSPEWLPPGFIEKTKYRNGKKIRYYLKVETGKIYNSKKDVMLATVDNGDIVTPQVENGDDNVLSSDKKVDDISHKTNDSPAWLPNGWKIEERIRHSGSSKGSTYKVYIDSSGENKFYSKAAVIRYLNRPNHANTTTVQNEVDNVDKPNLIDPNEIESNANESIVDDPKIVDVPSIDMSPQPVSMTNTGGTVEKKLKHNSFKTVSVETTTDDDLPGWIKEIRTSKSGKKIRKDPYYTDPVSGYIFRSKLDALRYLEYNDIGKCRCRPLKRLPDDVNLIDNAIPSSNPATEKFSVHKRQHLLGGESNGDEESPGAKIVAEPEEQKHENSESYSVKVTSVYKENIPCENAEKIPEIINDPQPLAFILPETDPSTKQQPSESGKRAKVNSRSKKRKDIRLPSRTSKRLAGSQPEMSSNSDLNESFLRAAGCESSASEFDKSFKDPASIPIPSETGPTKEANEQAFIGEETHQNPVTEVEKPPPEDPLNEVEKSVAEKPPTEVPTIQEEQLDGEASEKQTDGSKQLEESQLCYDWDSWSDPLEFALKTLRGDIPIDDSLTFPSFNEQISVPYPEDGCLKQSQPGAPANSELASHSGSAKPHLPADVLFGYNNCQNSTEVAKKDSQTKLNP